MKEGNVKTQVDFNDLCVVVIQLSDLKSFLGDLKSEGQLEEFLEEKRNEMMNHLDLMEYLLKVIYLFIDSKVQVQIDNFLLFSSVYYCMQTKCWPSSTTNIRSTIYEHSGPKRDM